VSGDAPRKRGRPRLGEVTSVRFPPALEAAAKAAAAREGKSTTGWIRGIIGSEIARRGGRCPACGQPVPQDGPQP
jgi:predicted HicB family RNase H-like nuclease